MFPKPIVQIVPLSLGSPKLALLYEEWLSCEGQWTSSKLLQQFRQERKHRKRGARKWLTYDELAIKYGSYACAQKIKDHKESDAECSRDQVRDHPDCPHDAVSWLYLFELTVNYLLSAYIAKLYIYMFERDLL